MAKLINEIGNRYGRLVVIAAAQCKRTVSGTSITYWVCKCDCGLTVNVSSQALRRGLTLSCKCLMKEVVSKRATKHGLSKTKLYELWRSMKSRCGPSAVRKGSYFDKGITVCDEWKDSPTEFVKWAQENGYEDGLQIDRIDNDKGYYPANCRFVQSYINTLNRRPLVSTNTTGYTGVHFDKVRCLFQSYIDVSKILEIHGTRVRLGRFKTAEEAVTARNNFIIEHSLPHKIQEIKP